MNPAAVRIILYRRGGACGPFRIKIPCGERALPRDVIDDTLANELAEIPVALEIHDWLSQVGPSTPITLPQIWLDGRYIGGADALGQRLHGRVQANPERGQSSLSAQDLSQPQSRTG